MIRSLSEFAAASIDDEWLIDAVPLTSKQPADAAEAAVLLRIAYRAESVFAARRLELTAAVVEAPVPSGVTVRASEFANLEIAVALTWRR